jgi:hypothetical protein
MREWIEGFYNLDEVLEGPLFARPGGLLRSHYRVQLEQHAHSLAPPFNIAAYGIGGHQQEAGSPGLEAFLQFLAAAVSNPAAPGNVFIDFKHGWLHKR